MKIAKFDDTWGKNVKLGINIYFFHFFGKMVETAIYRKKNQRTSKIAEPTQSCSEYSQTLKLFILLHGSCAKNMACILRANISKCTLSLSVELSQQQYQNLAITSMGY